MAGGRSFETPTSLGAYREKPGKSFDCPEVPKHEVEITEGYYIGKTEVTRAQYAAARNPEKAASMNNGNDPVKDALTASRHKTGSKAGSWGPPATMAAAWAAPSSRPWARCPSKSSEAGA